MIKISPQISEKRMNYSQFIGQKYPLRGEGFTVRLLANRVVAVFNL